MSAEKYIENIRKKLHNHTEDLVLNSMSELLKREKFQDICTCEECLVDMATYALNRLPAKYVATKKGEVYTKTAELEQQNSVDLLATVTKAINIVAKDCHHNNSRD
ncbi:MAG: late competence development ComFB family protein [Bacillota bacterium]